MSDGSPGQDFQLSVAALSIATLSWNFAKLVWNPHSAAREGAPQAIQCADRFHVLKNLREALEGLLARHLAAQCKRETQAIRDRAGTRLATHPSHPIPPNALAPSTKSASGASSSL